MPDPASNNFELTGAIRVSPNYDCIGIPVFSKHPSNASFVPETNSGLNIVAFQPFDTDDVATVPILNYPTYPQFYRIGDFVPIPFWVDNAQVVVVASREWQSVAGSFGTHHPVVTRVGQTLKRAQSSGKSRLLDEADAYQRFLEEKPTPDRYWVGRFKDLLTQAYTNALLPPTTSIVWEFSNLATRWARECAAKAETKVLRSFIEAIEALRSSADQRFTEAQTFALMRHIVSKPSASRQLGVELKRLPESTNSASIVDYLRATPFASDDDFVSAFEQLSRSLRTALINGRRGEIEDYTKLFGTSRSLPTQVSEIAHHLAAFKHSELMNLVRMTLASDSGYSPDVRQAFATQSLETARLLEAVYRLVYPEQRHADLYDTALMGIDRSTFVALRHVAEGRELLKGRH